MHNSKYCIYLFTQLPFNIYVFTFTFLFVSLFRTPVWDFKGEIAKGCQSLVIFLDEVENSNIQEYLTQRDDQNCTPLHYAAETKLFDCCEELTRRFPPILALQDNNGNTPLHYLVYNKYFEGCKKCIKYATPEHMNVANGDSLTVVHIAARDNAHEILQLLLDNGADRFIQAERKDFFTPLHFAANCGSSKCVKWLLEKLPERRKQTYTNLQTSNGSTAFMLAAAGGFAFCCYKLEHADVDIQDKGGFTALHYAARNRHKSVVQHIVRERKADVSKKNSENLTALALSAENPDNPCLEYILENTTLVDSPQDILKLVTNFNRTQCLQKLLERENYNIYIDHAFESENNDTLLHIALRKGFYKACQILLYFGAGKKIKNNNDEYPIHLAASRPYSESAPEDEKYQVLLDLNKYSHFFIDKVTK